MRVRPRQERSRDKVDRILMATAHVLEQNGPEAVTMASIARNADLPTPTVYHYFADRAAVFFALAERTIQAVDDALMQELQHLDPGAPDWPKLIRGLYQGYRQAEGYRRILPQLKATAGLESLMQESNTRTARVLEMVLVQMGLPAERVRRLGLMVAELVQQMLDQALCLNDEQEAQAWIDELVEMLSALSEYYFRQYTGSGSTQVQAVIRYVRSGLKDGAEAVPGSGRTV